MGEYRNDHPGACCESCLQDAEYGYTLDDACCCEQYHYEDAKKKQGERDDD